MMELILAVILFISGLIVGITLTYSLLKSRAEAWFEKWKSKREKEIRKDVVKRSRAAIKGKVGEQLAPLTPMFKYDPANARFIGSPIDYVIFKGYKEKKPEEIIFADVKTGEKSRLTPLQRRIKELVENGNVSWETIRLIDQKEP
ncbi:MAG: Holliday junction resolvase-like protein [Candidatus Hadarchaeia archaeon]